MVWHLLLPPQRQKRRLPHGTVPYALLVSGVLLVLLTSGSRFLDTLVHVLIGVCGVGAGILGRRTCKHVRHQVAVTAGLLLIEAYVSVWVVG